MAGMGPGKAYYMLKYPVKPQHDMYNGSILSAHQRAFDRAIENGKHKVGSEALSDQLEDRRRVMSMVNSMGAPVEMGAPLVNLYYLNHGSVFYKSHEIINIYLEHTMNKLCQRNYVEAAIGMNNTTQTQVDQDVDYIHRPVSMEDLSYYEFVGTVEKISIPRPSKKYSYPMSFGFLNTHPQLKWKHAKFRKQVHHLVPKTFCRRLPDIRSTR